MPSLLRVAPPVVHVGGGEQVVAADTSRVRNADILHESVRKRRSGEIAVSLPQAVNKVITLDGIGIEVDHDNNVNDDDEKEHCNNSKPSVLPDTTNKINSSNNEWQEGGKAPLFGNIHVGHALPKSTMTNSHMPGNQSQFNEPKCLPYLERFSEFRIDQASSIEDLEYIRRRLLLLLDRVNACLTEKRVKEALTQYSSGRFSSSSIDELSMPQLMDKLNQDIEKSSSSNGKGNLCAKLERAASTNESRKRQCRPCPLCLHKTAVPSSSSESAASTGSCEICERSGLCHRCYSPCPSCHRDTCADCLLSCGDCGLRYHCSDCVFFGGGKCNICRERPKATEKGVTGALDEKEKCTVELNERIMPISNQFNPATVVPQISLQQKSLPIPQSSNPSPSEEKLVQAAHPQKPPTHSELDDQTSPSSSQQSLPTISSIQSNPMPIPSQIHRFIISDKGILGINITSFQPSKKCIVSSVNPNSVAFHHGIEVGDEIILPKSISTGEEYPNVYDLFINAAKHRPLLFEVKRKYKSSSVPETLALVGPHSRHRFIISERASLGMIIRRRCRWSTIVCNVDPHTLGYIYGFCKNDIICEPFEEFCDSAKGGERPWIVNVLRPVSTTTEGVRISPIQVGRSIENPFIFSFPIENACTDETERMAVEDKVEGDAVEEGNNEGNVVSDIIVIDDDDE